VSCRQDIAGEGAFSLGMIAEYQASLVAHGPWFYRRLFWEAGAIGQVLYLEAEAAGVRATGIGCFFDDPVHQVFGLRDLASSRCITSPSAARSTIRASPRCRPTALG
jgi:Nitroreductase family